MTYCELRHILDFLWCSGWAMETIIDSLEPAATEWLFTTCGFGLLTSCYKMTSYGSLNSEALMNSVLVILICTSLIISSTIYSKLEIYKGNFFHEQLRLMPILKSRPSYSQIHQKDESWNYVMHGQLGYSFQRVHQSQLNVILFTLRTPHSWREWQLNGQMFTRALLVQDWRKWTVGWHLARWYTFCTSCYRQFVVLLW